METIPRLSQRQRRCFVDWFGVPEPDCPPNHYRLLHLAPLEQDPDRIAEAMARCRALVAVNAAETDRHDDALAAHHYLSRVESTLSDPIRKSEYDAGLLAESGHWRGTKPVNQPPLLERESAHAQPVHEAWPVPPRLAPGPTLLPGPPGTTLFQAPVSAGWSVVTTGATLVALVSFCLLGWAIAQGRLGGLGITATQAATSPGAGPLDEIAAPVIDPLNEGGRVEAEPTSDTTGPKPEAESPPVTCSIEKTPEDNTERAPTTNDTLAGGPATAPGSTPPEAVDAPARSVDLDPFDRFPEAIDLPGTPNDRGKLLGMKLGKLPASPDDLVVEIDQEAADLPAGQRLRLSLDRTAENAWRLELSGGLASDPLARVSVDEEGTLRFDWLPGAADHDAAAKQLSNTALRLRSGRHTHWLPLRKAIEIEHAPPHLGAGKHRVGLPALPNRPRPERLRLEVSAVEDLCDETGEPYHSNLVSIQPFAPDLSTTSTGVLMLGQSRIVLGSSGEVGIGVRLLSHPKTGPDLEIRPRYQSARSGRTQSAMTYQALQSKVLLQQKRCNGRLRRFREAVESILSLQQQLRQQDRIATTYQRRNSAQAAGHRHKAITLGRDLKTCRTTAIAAAKNIPTDYALMHRHFGIERHAKGFDSSGGLRYRVYAQGGAGEIDLFRAVKPRGSYTKPDPARQQDTGVVAEWLCLNPPAVCTLLPNGKSVVKDLATARTGYGAWTQNGESVVLTGPRPYGRFELADGIRLAGGNTELYRYFHADR